ncbi:hypothetical protein Taro_025478, partial [Colocasia esculenta]|nr:hypothetical protein [Colocasia esculenta]
ATPATRPLTFFFFLLLVLFFFSNVAVASLSLSSLPLSLSLSLDLGRLLPRSEDQDRRLARPPCMAHAVPAAQRRIVLVAPRPPPPPHHLIVAATAPHAAHRLPPPPSQLFPLPLPLPPPPPAGYLVRQGTILVAAANPAVVVSSGAAGGVAAAHLPRPALPVASVPIPPRPPLPGMGRVLLANVGEMRNHTLAQFMSAEGLVPSQEEELKRVAVIVQLKKIVMMWIKKVALLRQLPSELIECASATILPYGSYGLGVHGSESDIDILCVGPYYATLEEDFFVILHDLLQNRPEVCEVQCVKSAKVPLMRFKFNGISVDFPYSQLNAFTVPDNVDLSDPYLLKIDETSWRSLSGVRANICILNLVPNLKDFQATLRCLKLWAKRRGIYSHLLGFFGGIHLAVLVAYVCRRFPNASVSALISIFFDIFLHWPWPKPVVLHDQAAHMLRLDGRSLMPIMMPCSPYEWCNSNITRSTYSKIMSEFLRGYSLMKDPKPDFDWCTLFEPYPYSKKYKFFLRILLVAPDLEEVQGYCDPNPTEYVDHDTTEPNAIFYWGLSLTDRNLIDVENLKHEFMRSVDKDNYGGSDGSCCKLELSVVDASQLPKNMLSDTDPLKGPKACWKILGYNLEGKPVYARMLPRYGYSVADGGYPTAVGFKVPSPVPAFGYQQDPRAASGYLIACSAKGPSFRARSAQLVPKTPSKRTTLPCIRHLAASHAFEHQVPSSGLDYRVAGLAHRVGYLLGTFLSGEPKRPFIPLRQL